MEGNRRFRQGSQTSLAEPWSRKLATQVQRPYAIILGCFDSRAPIELLFDAGFGELFVVRIAGNVVPASVMGSIEFAAVQFGSPLVLVLGHTSCAAVAAAIEAVERGVNPGSENVRSITDRIIPHIERLVRAGENRTLLRLAVRANIRGSADALRQESRVIQELVLAGRLAVVGAEYELETGEVHLVESVSSMALIGSTAEPSLP